MKKINNFVGLFSFARNAPKSSSKSREKSTTKPVITELQDRCLISIEGPDAKKILQDITTNDIDAITQDPQLASQYTLFLNIRGRVFADAMIIKPRIFTNGALGYKQNEYWLDVHMDSKQKLAAHIGRCCREKQVKIRDIQTPFKICAMYNDPLMATVQNKSCGLLVQPEEALQGAEGSYSNISFVDPRLPSLGIRMLMNGDEYDNENFNILPTDNYDFCKTLHAVCDGPEIVDGIPFTYNLDLLRGISFTKTQYIGQELISKVYRTGIVRRRVFPFVLREESKAGDFEVGKSFVMRDKEIGKVVKFNKSNGIGLALINYLDLEPFEQQLRITSPARVVILNPLRHQIKEYLQTLKEKIKAEQRLDE